MCYSFFIRLKKLVVKQPVQPVSAFPGSQASIPGEQKDYKRKFSQQLNLKSPGQC